MISALQKTSFSWLLFILSIKGFSQNPIALPEIINFTKQVYNAGAQNWNIGQDAQGIIYVANNEGLLTFDGSYWKKYPLPNLTIIRSLAVTDNGRVYIGAQGEIGYFEPGEKGELLYHSLNTLIPEKEKDFADVWDVVPYKGDVFFRVHKRILQLKENKITAYSHPSWSFLGEVNGRLICKAFKKGLLLFQNQHWVPFLKNNIMPDEAQITSVVSLDENSALVATLKHGFYILKEDELIPFHTTDMERIAERNPYHARSINENQIGIVTNMGGFMIVNKEGKIIQELSRKDGLQTNNVLCTFIDRDQNIWLGLNSGIDFIAYNTSIKHIYPDYQERNAGHAAIIYRDHLYLGTPVGLFKAPVTEKADISLGKGDFTLVPGTRGQVWNVSVINDHLMMGHNNGLFIVTDNGVRRLDGPSGVWNFFPLNSILPAPVFIAGTYNGINFYHYQNGSFSNPSIHTHFESARYIAIDNNIAWVAHPYKGLYKVILNQGNNPTYKVYEDIHNILSLNRNHLFKVKNRIVLSNDKGFFEYNLNTDDFEESSFFKNIFGSSPVQYLVEDDTGKIWFISNKRLGAIDFSGNNFEIIHFPELNDRIMGNGFEFVYPYNDKNIFIAGEEGFYHINYELYKVRKKHVPLVLSTVGIIDKPEGLLYGGFGKTAAAKIDYASNSLHFGFSSPAFGERAGIEYSSFLEGQDTNWSLWSGKNERDFIQLAPGNYTFHVKARSHEGWESPVAKYEFTILAPWYRTPWAYMAYVLSFVILILALQRWQKRKLKAQQQKHEAERKQMEYLHQLELDRTEKEIIRLKNEKLESEIQHKNSELAATTMNLVQKGEMLAKVKEEFERLKKNDEVDKESEDYKKIIRILSDDRTKKDWEQFAVHFDKVHSDFLVLLKSSYPNLTPGELKLCAYLRLNLSSKEIAQIMNITIKSVELSRHRLRKKLQIQPDINLYNFLLNFHS
ncbi:MAG: hypothetical protein KIT80_11410 [Chitinophagaceae bacterium]|nr:hypothetical protein [Chitinophagaceae bacterium]MCW5927509.1 hypothetical protein [Chitinophagaceae bacterium]